MAPASAAPTPPALPPSVEEAYRRKCIQLKQRTSQVEEANDAARLRLSRLKRQCEKMRLERAFLLEQLAKRTSTNVEDSDGSPSPPPTPKEKPLRIKRGHRKPSMLTSFDTPPAGAASSVAGGNEPTGRSGSNAFLGTNTLRQTQSPSSDAFSTQPGDGRSKANGLRFGPAPRKPGTAFELYSAETRAQSANGADGDKDHAEELARGWKGLENHERMAFESRAEAEMEQYEKEKLAYDVAVYQKEKDSYDEEANAEATKSGNATEEVDMDVDETDRPRRGSESAAAAADAKESAPVGDDTEMNYDTDPEETQGEKPDE